MHPLVGVAVVILILTSVLFGRRILGTPALIVGIMAGELGVVGEALASDRPVLSGQTLLLFGITPPVVAVAFFAWRDPPSEAE